MEATEVLAQRVWGGPQRSLRVQILGAGSVTGRELACALLAAGHPAGHLQLHAARARSLEWHGVRLVANDFDAVPALADVVFLCTGHPGALGLAALHAQRGTRLVDVVGAWRHRPDVPLVGPGTSVDDPGVFSQIVGLPGRTALLAAQPLWALERDAGLERVDLTALVSAAVEGSRGILELREELSVLGRCAGRERQPVRVGNVLPLPGGGARPPEIELALEVRRLLGRPSLPLDATLLRVDAERCDALSFHVRLGRALGPGEAAAILGRAPAVRVVEGDGPTPRDTEGRDHVAVGRIRPGSGGACSLCFFAVGDQLRFGAALAAMQVAARFAIG